MNDTVVLEGEFGLFMDTGQEAVIESFNVTENGTYTAGSGVDGYSPVTVNVTIPEPSIESLTVTENGTYTAEGDGYNPVTVNVPAYVPVISSLTVSEDGTYTAPSRTDGYSPVTVNTGVAALQSEIESAETISGCDPLVSGLTALVTYSNGITEASDTTVSGCITTLASGYGSGNSPLFSVEITEAPSESKVGAVFDCIVNEIPQDYANETYVLIGIDHAYDPTATAETNYKFIMVYLDNISGTATLRLMGRWYSNALAFASNTSFVASLEVGTVIDFYGAIFN